MAVPDSMHAQTSLATTHAPRTNGFFLMKRERRSCPDYIIYKRNNNRRVTTKISKE
jgi:hypothetical protein